MNIGNKPYSAGAHRKTSAPTGEKKFRIPQKGRIRVALALVLLIIIVKYAGPCVCGGDEKELTQEKAVPADTARPADKRPKPPPVPGYMMSFDDVRWLVSEYGVTVNAPEQKVAVSKSDSKKRRRSGKGPDDDTLSVCMSIDTSLHKYAMNMLRRYKPRYGTVVAIDPSTGRVLVLASYAGEDEPIDGSDLYLKSIFPAASIFKTVVAAAGIERGNMNRDTPVQHFGRNHTLYKTQLEKDLKVSKDVSLQDAYAYSINPVFGRIALFHVNKDAVLEFGRRFGFNDDAVPFEFTVEKSTMLNPDSTFSIAEFASGFNRETTLSPILGALMAGAICENGVILKPTVVDSIRSSKRDTIVYSRAPEVWRRAVKENTASELRWLMEKVTHYGTARTPFRSLRGSDKYNYYQFGGKTGSVNQLGLGRVDWFIGFARNTNNKNQRLAIGVVTTHGEYWTVHSSYIAAELFKKYITNNERQTTAPKPPK